MPKITPFLWFDGKAEEAARFYVSVFGDGKITDSNPMMTSFEIEGQAFIGLNGGPKYKFTEAVSFFISCQTQAEVDHFWDRLSEGGEPHVCGWLKDRYGLSWQVVPDALGRLMSDPDPARSQRVMQAMLKMTKIVIADLEAAHAG
jgi:predicted 3-demethylubiquinone-9 3-methyltransferase (glyoxalase superfamily)